MNKGGTTIFFSIMMAVVLLLLAINLANPLKVVIDNARTQTNSSGIETALNCSTAITYQEKANCVVVDIMLPLFILVLIGLVGFILTQI